MSFKKMENIKLKLDFRNCLKKIELLEFWHVIIISIHDGIAIFILIRLD